MARCTSRGRAALAAALTVLLASTAGCVASAGPSPSAWNHPSLQVPGPAHRRLSPGQGSKQHHQPPCDLCAQNWLFILSEFRTGSTTALAMFNSVPGFEILGEHMGILNDEEAIARHAWEAQHRPGAAFNGAKHGFDRGHFLCSVQDRMRHIILGHDIDTLGGQTAVLGFKEIRYGNLRTIRFIAEAFPCARFLFTLREDADAPINAKGFNVVARGDWLHGKWGDWAQLAHKIHSALPSTTWLLPLESNTVEHYRGVLQELGVKGCKYRYLLHENADGGTQHDSGLAEVMEGDCDLSAVDFRLTAREIAENQKAWRLLEEQVKEMCKTSRVMCPRISPDYTPPVDKSA